MITLMCDFTDYGILEKQKITNRITNEDNEVGEDEPELERLESQEVKPREDYIPATQ